MTADFQSDFDAFRRTVLRSAGKKSFSYEEAADFCTEQYQKNGDLLLVVNTKQAALTIFQKLKERNSEFATVLHLYQPLHQIKHVLASKHWKLKVSSDESSS